MEIIARHYERLTMVHEVYEDETKKPQEKQPREANLFIPPPIILNLGRVLNVNIH